MLRREAPGRNWIFDLTSDGRLGAVIILGINQETIMADLVEVVLLGQNSGVKWGRQL